MRECNGGSEIEVVLMHRRSGTTILGTDPAGYTTEDGLSNYTTEDGSAIYYPGT